MEYWLNLCYLTNNNTDVTEILEWMFHTHLNLKVTVFRQIVIWAFWVIATDGSWWKAYLSLPSTWLIFTQFPSFAGISAALLQRVTSMYSVSAYVSHIWPLWFGHDPFQFFILYVQYGRDKCQQLIILNFLGYEVIWNLTIFGNGI